jgi:hypothetical protein
MVIGASEQDRFVLEQLWQGLCHLVAQFRRSKSQSASATLPQLQNFKQSGDLPWLNLKK